MWIAKIAYNGDSGIEVDNIVAPTLNSLYVKIHKHLLLGVLEIHIYRGAK